MELGSRSVVTSYNERDWVASADFGKENRYNLQFRIEAFNALNHANWNTAGNSLQGGGAFGTITSTNPNVPNRVVQLAAKFNF